MLEAREIGGRIGCPIAQTPQDRHAVTRKLGDFTPSMLQDARAGRPLELNALTGAVRELGALTGVPTPYVDALHGLARLYVRAHTPAAGEPILLAAIAWLRGYLDRDGHLVRLGPAGGGEGPHRHGRPADDRGLPRGRRHRRAGPTRTPAAWRGCGRRSERGEARFVGKTNLHELAYGITGVNEAFGTPVNPLDPRRVPGGSSSGSATAVAAGEADVAYGTDTGGSIRIPAACCGIAGLKTTWGRISLDGVRPLAPSLDTVGPMAADVDGLIAGMALLEPGFAVAADAPRTVGRLAIDADPVVDAAVDDALRAAGFAVQRITIPELQDVIAASAALLDAQAWATNAALFGRAADRIGANVRDRLRAGEHDHRRAAERRPDDEHPVEGAPSTSSGAGSSCWRCPPCSGSRR